MSDLAKKYVRHRAAGLTCREAAKRAGYASLPSSSARELYQAYQRMQKRTDLAADWVRLHEKIDYHLAELKTCRQRIEAIRMITGED